jgi:DNA invertase Pin-like site-specific DNA recombinase
VSNTLYYGDNLVVRRDRATSDARTGEGRARAVARGQKMGRPFKPTDHQKREAIRRRDHDGEPVREIARSYNVSHSTISRLIG